MKKALFSLLLASACAVANGQVHYTGTTISNPYQHDGGLSPVVGIHCIQTMRANREHPDSAGNVMPWTYNHQPMLAQWKGRLWMHYLSDPASEHIPPSQTFMQWSEDGYGWSAPQTLFPDYGMGMMAVMHQRVGWYVSSKETGERLLAIGHYGICEHPKDDPNDGRGIGRVVREVKADGTLGPVFFLYHNKDCKHKDVKYRWQLYTECKDRKFRKACEEILANPLYWMQMVEECDRNDERLPLKNQYKAFSYYTLPDDSTIVGLWKHALTSQSKDGGKTWTEPVARAKGFVNSNAKIWGQRLSDGTYATVYNPSEYRWPLAISTSADGEEYTTLNLVHGEISPMRYGGQYKSRGPQYVRGILPGNKCGELTNGAGEMHVAYSMNKEDMWVAKVPVPVRTEALEHADDDFAKDGVLNKWNIMSLVYAPVKVSDGRLMMADRDRHDFAKAERIIPATRLLEAEMEVTPMQCDHGSLEIELLDSHGTPCTRMTFQSDSLLTIKTGARYSTLIKGYEAGRTYHIKLLCDLDNRMITLWIDGKKMGPKMLFAPIDAVTRIAFRTGARRFYPTPDTPADTPEGEDLADAGAIDKNAIYYINKVKTAVGNDAAMTVGNDAKTAVCDAFGKKKIHDYVSYFNDMEPEGIVQAIPNSEAEAWMQENIPVFECPDKQIEEMYYYRWWSFRKAIRETPLGYVINEFLVERSYADKYNLIACALGHHIMEGRWLRNSKYLDDDIEVWLRGNDRSDSLKVLPTKDSPYMPMWRLDTFSSWLPYAMWQRALQQGSTSWMAKYNTDLCDDLWRWEESNSYGDGLFWQRDVKDGMEEQISGARKQNNRRPTINSYMWGNYSAMALLNEGTAVGKAYQQKADALKSKIEQTLWNKDLEFYGTMTVADTLAKVREEIGYIPWYFNMPEDDAAKYLPAWQQLWDEKGFNAPFGITTAERRHPLFRKRFRPNHPSCEWDGAVWPFATSQTLTALANIYSNYPSLAAAITEEYGKMVERNMQEAAKPGTDIKKYGTGNLFFDNLKKYTESQYRRGRPYIGEYLDEKNGQWLMGERERSKYYNHSTYCDLIITGLCGLRPSMKEGLPEVHPLIPDSWNYFRISGIPYHGKLLTIIYDKDGSRYHQGKGVVVIEN